MTRLAREPDVIMVSLLEDHFDPANIRVPFDPPSDVTTGRAEQGRRYPSISVTAGNEGTLDGGDTGMSSFHPGSGSTVQDRQGVVYLECWGGSVDDYASEDPQDVRADLKNEVVRVLGEYGKWGTWHPTTGERELDWIIPDDELARTDTQVEPPRYWFRCSAVYLYTRTF